MSASSFIPGIIESLRQKVEVSQQRLAVARFDESEAFYSAKALRVSCRECKCSMQKALLRKHCEKMGQSFPTCPLLPCSASLLSKIALGRLERHEQALEKATAIYEEKRQESLSIIEKADLQ